MSSWPPIPKHCAPPPPPKKLKHTTAMGMGWFCLLCLVYCRIFYKRLKITMQLLLLGIVKWDGKMHTVGDIETHKGCRERNTGGAAEKCTWGYRKLTQVGDKMMKQIASNRTKLSIQLLLREGYLAIEFVLLWAVFVTNFLVTLREVARLYLTAPRDLG